jgi:hypothetical protein
VKQFVRTLGLAAVVFVVGCGGDSAKTDAPPSVQKVDGPAVKESAKPPEKAKGTGTQGPVGEEGRGALK